MCPIWENKGVLFNLTDCKQNQDMSSMFDLCHCQPQGEERGKRDRIKKFSNPPKKITLADPIISPLPSLFCLFPPRGGIDGATDWRPLSTVKE